MEKNMKVISIKDTTDDDGDDDNDDDDSDEDLSYDHYQHYYHYYYHHDHQHYHHLSTCQPVNIKRIPTEQGFSIATEEMVPKRCYYIEMMMMTIQVMMGMMMMIIMVIVIMMVMMVMMMIVMVKTVLMTIWVKVIPSLPFASSISLSTILSCHNMRM